MSTLILDAGNTSVKVTRWNDPIVFPNFCDNGFSSGQAADHPTEVGSVSTSFSGQNPGEFVTRIKSLNSDEHDRVVLVSVIPGVEKLLHEIWPDLKVVGRPNNLPFSHEIREPETVGPDRFCNIACAVASGLKSALVVDAGTATTFDLLLDGVFEGGLIAPGMVFSAQQLARQGAMLSEVPFEVRPAKVGHDTREAMMGGAWLTGCGGIEWTIARLIDTYGPLPVILTGGLAGILPSENRYVDHHWTLRGAGFLADSDN